ASAPTGAAAAATGRARTCHWSPRRAAAAVGRRGHVRRRRGDLEECLGSGCHGWMAGGGCCAAKADCLLVAAGDRHFYTSCEAAANATRRAETCPGIQDVCECGRKGCFPQEVGNGEFACFGDYQGVAGRMIRPEECEGFSGGGKIPGPRPADQITDTPIQ
ncbi:unnamed protein product, partial [Prorocentrum cordatum]